MKKNLFIISMLLVLSSLYAPAAHSGPVRFADIQPELETNLAALSESVEPLEAVQAIMDASGRANDNYNQQKNIFLSSMLAISTISTVCGYETDLLTLFIDLKENFLFWKKIL